MKAIINTKEQDDLDNWIQTSWILAASGVVLHLKKQDCLDSYGRKWFDILNKEDLNHVDGKKSRLCALPDFALIFLPYQLDSNKII